MRKLIVYLLFITAFHSHVQGMDKKEINKEVPEKSIFPLEIEKLIIDHALNDTHIHAPTPLEAKKYLHKVSALNKYSYTLANSPCMIRTIIGNLSDNHFQNNCAQIIATPGAQNYLRQSNILHKHFDKIPMKRIRELFTLGADLNYFPCWQIPLLCKSQSSLEKTTLLLELGANPNTYGVDAIRTPLSHAINTDNIPVARLLLTYPLHNKCLIDASNNNDSTILALILSRNDITTEELNDGLKVALQNNNKKAADLLQAQKVIQEITKGGA